MGQELSQWQQTKQNKSQNKQWGRKLSAAFAILLLLAQTMPLVTPLAAYGQEVLASNSLPDNLSLDLSSVQASLPANVTSSAAVQVGGVAGADGVVQGGTTMTITPGQLLTPAQYMALQQTLSGEQNLVLGNEGQAIGGHIAFAPSMVSNLATLTLPANVNLASIGFNETQPLNISGTALVQGAIYALQPNAGLTSVFNMDSLTIASGGLLSGQLPANLGNIFSSVYSSNGLTLNVVHDVINMGTIVTPGTLTVNAGGSIYNQTVNGVQALMQAQAMNLMAGSGSFINSGLITATTNNLNLTSQLLNNITINNIGGTLDALSGNINVRDALFADKAHLVVWGGDIATNELNLHSGTGIINVNVNELSGTVNIYGHEAHVQAASPNLTLGTMQLTGDPTFYNTAGNVVINSTLSGGGFAGNPLAIVASGNITTAAGAGAISTRGGAGTNGGSILMVAGAQFTSDGPASVLPPPPGDTVSTLTITGGSATGGRIDLNTGTAITSLDSRGNGAGTNGGDITLVAYAGSAANSGEIRVPTAVNIRSGGGGGVGVNGDVTIIAGAAAGTAIITGAINTSGATGGPGQGDIKIYAATPVITASGAPCSPCLKVLPGGAIDPAAGFFANGALQNAAITTSGNITARRSDITYQSNGAITVASGGRIDNTGGGTGTGNGGIVTISGGGNVTLGRIVNDAITTGNGGTVTVSGVNVVIEDNAAATSIIARGIGTGDGGTVNITSNSATNFTISNGGGSVNETWNRINVSAAGNGNGGSITIHNTGAGGISLPNLAQAVVTAAGTGNGGTINFNGSTAIAPNPGALSLGSGTLAANAGAVSGNGGTITLRGSTFAVTGGGNLILTANAAAGGNGGTIAVTTTGSAVGANITVGAAAGNIALSATGGSGGSVSGNGGNITVSSGRNLTVAPASLTAGPLGINGNGATINLAAGSATAGNLFINGSLTANGIGTGTGGTVSLTSNSATAFNINPGAITNGVNGTLTANAGGTSGNGGSISAINNGAGGITLGAPGNITVTPSAGGGQGGSITLDATAGAVDGTLTISGPGTLGGAFSASARGANFAGGSILLAGSTIAITGAPLTLNANATGTSNGGTISVTTTGATGSLAVGSGAGQLNISATGGSGGSASGNGGNVTLSAGQNLTIDGSSLNALPAGTNGNGPTLAFTAGTAASGVLQINGTISADGAGTGNGGFISLSANTVGSSVDVTLGASLSAINSAGTITVNTLSFTNNGSLTASSDGGGYITIDSPSALAYSGDGTVTLSGSGASAITVSANGANQLALNGSQIFDAGASGYVYFLSYAAGGSISYAAGTTQTISSGSGFEASSPAMTFGDAAAIAATGASDMYLDSGAATNALLITLPDNSQATVSTNGGWVSVWSGSGQNLTFAKSAGSNATTFNLNGGPVLTYTDGGAITTINANVTLASDNNIDLAVLGGGTLTDNGTITTSLASGAITIFADDASLTLNGTPSTLAVTGGGTGIIRVLTAGSNNLNINSAYTFDAGANGVAALSSAAINITAATTLSAIGGTSLELGTGSLSFAAGSGLSSDKTSGNAVSITQLQGGLTITSPDSSSATISSGGGTIEITAASGLTFAKSAGAGTTTLNLNDVPAFIRSDAGTLTIDSNVTVASNNNIDIQVNGGGTLTDNGTITSSASAGSIAISGNLGLTLNGSPQPITVTGGSTASISLIGYNTAFNINSSYTLNPGANGTTSVLAGVGDINIAGGTTLAVAGGGPLTMAASVLFLGSGSTISDSKTSGVAINIGSPNSPLTIRTVGGSSATIASGGGSIVISPTGGGHSLTFDSSGAGSSTLNVNGGQVNISVTAAPTVITANNTLSSNNDINFDLSGSTLTNNGTISSLGNLGFLAAANLNIAGSGSLSATAVSLSALTGSVTANQATIAGNVSGSALRNYNITVGASNLALSNISTTNGSISITAAGSTLSILAGALINANEGNITLLNTNTTSGTITLGAGSTVFAFTVGDPSLGNVYICLGSVPGSPIAGTPPANVTINSVAGGQVYFGANGIVASAPTNVINAIGRSVVFDTNVSPASAISLEGGVTITADPPLPDGTPAVLLKGSLEAVPAMPATISSFDNSLSNTSNKGETNLAFLLSSPLVTDVLVTDSQGGLAENHLLTVPQEDVASGENSHLLLYPAATALSLNVPNDAAQPGQSNVITRHSHNAAHYQVLYTGMTKIQEEKSGLLSLEMGEALISSAKHTTVESGNCKVVVPSQTIALITKSNNSTKVRNLYENSLGSLHVIVGQQAIPLAAGQEAIITSSETPVTFALGNDKTGRRHIKTLELAEGQKAICSDYSLTSLIQNTEVLGLIKQSQETSDKVIFSKMLKMAACLMIVTARHGAYTPTKQ